MDRHQNLRQENRSAVEAHVGAVEPRHVAVPRPRRVPVGQRNTADCNGFISATLQQTLARFKASPATVCPRDPTDAEVAELRMLITQYRATHPSWLGATTRSNAKFRDILAVGEHFKAIVTVITADGEEVHYQQRGSRLAYEVLRFAYFDYGQNGDGHYEAVVPEGHPAALGLCVAASASGSSAVQELAPSLQSAAESESGAYECGICNDSVPAPAQKGCGCIGNLGAVHISCLQKEAAQMQALGASRWTHCQTCKRPLGGPAQRTLALDWVRWCATRGGALRAVGREMRFATTHMMICYQNYACALFEQRELLEQVAKQRNQRKRARTCGGGEADSGGQVAPS